MTEITKDVNRDNEEKIFTNRTETKTEISKEVNRDNEEKIFTNRTETKTEISKEVNRDNEETHEMSSLTNACRVKCSIPQHNDNANSTMEDDSPDSAIGNIGSVESSISYTESDFSSTYCVSDASPSTIQQNESPYTEDPITPCSDLQSSTTLYVRVQHNQEQNIVKQKQDQGKQQYSREQDQLGTYLGAESKSPATKSRKSLEYIQRENIRKVMQYKDHLQGNWKYLKKAVDVGMVQSFEKVRLAREDEFRKLKSHRRSKVADMLVMRIMQRIENATDIMNFENTIGKPVCDKLTTCQAKYYRTEEKDQKKNLDLLKANRQFMIDNFMTDDIENVKDCFVQEFIISIDENDEIINEQGFYERQNTKFNEYFVETFIINKSYIGSYQCLLEYLELLCKNGSTRLRELLKRLKTNKKNTTDQNVKGPIVSISTLPIGYKDMSTERYRSTAGKDLKLIVQFTANDDIEKKKIYKEVIHKAKTKNGLIGRDLGACIDNAYSGSIVIHMVALHNEMIQTVIDKIRNGQFSAFIKLLLNDLKIKRLLPCGKHELEVICSVADKQKHFRYIHKSNPIAHNKSFLEEEMDTIYVLKELEKHGVQIGIDVNDGDREYRARHIMTKALAEKTIATTLYKVLLDGEMVNVKNRLLKYETVYKSDASQLQEHIFKHFPEIIRKVFLDDIRRIFTDRNIFKDEMFEVAEESEERHEVSMANILTEIIKMGTDAMLTLVDALYVIQLDKLADKLMKIELLDDDGRTKTKKKCDPVYINKQIHVKSSDTNLLAIGRYELTVKRRKPTNKKRAAATKRPAVVACTRSRKIPKLEPGTVHDMLLYDVRDGYVFCIKEKCLQFPVSAPNVDFQYQHPDGGATYRRTHPLKNRFDNSYAGFYAQSQTTTPDWISFEYSRCRSGYDFSSHYTHKGPYTKRPLDTFRRLSNDGSSNGAGMYSKNASDTDYLSSWLSKTSIDERWDSSMDIEAEYGNDVHILSNDDTLSELALPPASTTYTKDSGSSVLLESSVYAQMISSPASTTGTTDSNYSIQLEADGYIHRTRSPASISGTTDSGYSTQLEPDSYTNRRRSPTSTIGTTDCGYPTQLETDGYTKRVHTPDSMTCSTPGYTHYDEDDRSNDCIYEPDISEKPIIKAWRSNQEKKTEFEIDNDLLGKDPCDVLIPDLVIKENQTTLKVQRIEDKMTENDIGNNLRINDSSNVNTQEMDIKTKSLTTQPVSQSDNNMTEFVIGNNTLIDDFLQELVKKKTPMIKTWKPNDEIFPEVETEQNIVINGPADHLFPLVLNDHSSQ